MRADATSWQNKPFTDGAEVPYRADYDLAEFERLRDGLIPMQMEDKWFIYYERPYLFVHRSWTGYAYFRVTLEEHAGGARVVEALHASNLKEPLASDDDFQAALLAFLIGNLLLDKGLLFPRPRGIEEAVPGVFQHALAGTRYPEKPFPDEEA